MAQSANVFRNPLFPWGIPATSTATIVAVAFLLVDDRTVRLMMLAVAAVDLLVTPQIPKRPARNAEDPFDP
ncbi:hypothetical protein [Halorubrum tebenquichense]|uniref:Uncharacterized protein n=1 Tax=Halorubrum tebenquichense DSM 14210 TaxID=1227485 RepID=M0E1G6_9EURY|nr:hypothetical protein [Halorubrum tebenquichense]ELZ41635.1 hypothetical protein C472_00843 [Halorubrum tebenquichense DSM 14210]